MCLSRRGADYCCEKPGSRSALSYLRLRISFPVLLFPEVEGKRSGKWFSPLRIIRAQTRTRMRTHAARAVPRSTTRRLRSVYARPGVREWEMLGYI